jgi:hypothetical protein
MLSGSKTASNINLKRSRTASNFSFNALIFHVGTGISDGSQWYVGWRGSTVDTTNHLNVGTSIGDGSQDGGAWCGPSVPTVTTNHLYSNREREMSTFAHIICLIFT